MKILVWFSAVTGDFSAEADFCMDGRLMSIRIGNALFDGPEMQKLVSREEILRAEREFLRLAG